MICLFKLNICISFYSVSMEDPIFSELINTLYLSTAKISLENLDYIFLGEQLVPSGDVVAINSNFVHKSLDGYEKYIKFPKARKSNRKLIGDGSCFNSCIDFHILGGRDDVHHCRYFPKSGFIQMFSNSLIYEKLIQYFSNTGLPAFASIKYEYTIFDLFNYKFSVKKKSDEIVVLHSLAYILSSDENSPFPVHFSKNDLFGVRKIAIFYNANTTKILVHIWPSGKINLYGIKNTNDSLVIYNYLHDVFLKNWHEIIKKLPIPDSKF